jgi:adenylate cyclase
MIRLAKILNSPPAAAVAIVLVVFGLLFPMRNLGNLELLELNAYDFFLGLESKVQTSPPITEILIDETDLQKHGWPITDEQLNRILHILLRNDPRTIGIDIYRDLPVPPGHQELSETLRDNTSIIGTMKFGQNPKERVRPPEVLEGTDRYAFNDILVDPGGTVRRGLLFLDDGENYYTSFSLRLAMAYLMEEGIYPQADPDNPEYIRLGSATIKPLETNDGAYIKADMRGYQFLLDYQDAPELIARFSLDDLLSERIEPGMINDRIVLIGFSAESVKDFFYTPQSRTFTTHQQSTGVELHALITSQLIRSAQDGDLPKFFWPDHLEYWWIFLWTALGIAIGFRFRSLWLFASVAATGLALLNIVAYWSFTAGWWIPVVPPAMGWIASSSLSVAYMSYRENRQRALLMNLFSKHVSPQVADAIWQQRDEVMESGRLRSKKLVATMMFVDLKGYTAVSEKMEPQELIQWLNSYLEAMTDRVIEYDGIINTYLGDGLMAGFGIPIPRSSEEQIGQDAANAIRCALALEKDTERLNREWEKSGMPAVQLRVGVHTGPLVAGSLGSSERMMYSTIGDTVNVASRLESFSLEEADFTAGTNCRILISDSTRSHVEGSFVLEPVGEVALKGKESVISA